MDGRDNKQCAQTSPVALPEIIMLCVARNCPIDIECNGVFIEDFLCM